MALEESAARALEVLNGLLTAAEEGRARMLDARERVVSVTARFETDWAALRERARAFLEQATAQEQQLVTVKAEATRAAEGLRAGLEGLIREAGTDLATTQQETDALGVTAGDEVREVKAVLQSAQAVEADLETAVREVEQELQQVVGEAEAMLQGVLAQELRLVEQETEREAIELSAYFVGQCIPVIERKAYELYNALVRAEEEVRAALEGSLDSVEATAEAVLRDAATGYDDTLSDLRRLGSSLEDLVGELADFIGDGRARVEDRTRRWDEAARASRERLRDAVDALREAEAFLSRFSFGR